MITRSAGADLVPDVLELQDLQQAETCGCPSSYHRTTQRHYTSARGEMRATSWDDAVITHLLRGGSGNCYNTRGSYRVVLITPVSIEPILEHALHKEPFPGSR